jgi:hypothetical protein
MPCAVRIHRSYCCRAYVRRPNRLTCIVMHPHVAVILIFLFSFSFFKEFAVMLLQVL